MKKPIYLSLYVLCLCLFSTAASATHIRAGEITARRLSSQSLEYEITIWGYSDASSEVLFGSNGTLDFGDGTSLQLNNTGDPDSPTYLTPTRLNDGTWLYTFKVKHTFPSARSYRVSFREFYRNEGILNMDNSLNMPFYIETLLVIDPLLGANSTPVLKRPAIDIAIAGKTYHHQPGAFDAEGDSLAYKITNSRQDRHTPVANYRFPHQTFPEGDPRNGNSETGDAPVFSINPISGDIIWDAPGTKGEYNVVFVVEEWRKVNGNYYLLSKVLRDMQIIVEEGLEGGRVSSIPQLSYPFSAQRVAPTAGETFEWTITAQAPTASDSVVLELWGDFLQRSNATASSTSVRAIGEASITIQWTGEEDQGQHYQLVARSYYPESPAYTRNRATVFYYNETEQPLGLDQAGLPGIKAFPNPVTGGTFFVNLPEATGKQVALQVFDMKGRLVQQQSDIRLQEVHAVELQEAKKGIYLLLLHHNGKIYQQKLIVQ